MFNLSFNPEVFGFIAAILTSIAFIPQLFRTWTTKSAKDVSFVMLIMFLTGVICWITYGWQINSLPIIVANSITFILNLLILALKLFFRKKSL